MIRIGTRMPIVLPHRITSSLKKVLGKYHRVSICVNTQCNHPKKITNIGKIPSMPDYYIVEKNEKEYKLKNYNGSIQLSPIFLNNNILLFENT